ncbi:MAG: FAD-dependent oxidoreductase [Methanomassiliicoccales archaeon]|nr:FAD-dependent oxidoreductase [Methanomassiliicoccales archaeon]NYT15586.1 FAD-dependent oxidoreductase [Methanomassiliicoccales archaeon]
MKALRMECDPHRRGNALMTNGENRILIIGGGISGISAALDLANQGHEVILVERDSTIGGHMARLDKTFPTLDCAICILSPKMVEVSRNPRIKLLTCSEVIDVKEIDGRFTVTVERKPRYVDESKCTGCGICMESCPSTKIPNEFNEEMDFRAAIWIPFPQAVPRIATIDPEHCLKLREGKCGVCQKKCPVGAIDYNMRGEKEEIQVSSILIATGFEPLEPVDLQRYGYWDNDNVITAIQLERMLNASGPTKGHVLRPSDGVPPKKIAFVLCAGSRDVKCKEYCSKICCMYSAKDAMLVLEHEPESEVTIFYNDLRAIGNGGEEFLDRAARTPGVRYLRGLPAQVQGDDFGNLSVRYHDIERALAVDGSYDMVVLFTPILPRSGMRKLAEILDIELDEQGFVYTGPENNVQSSREGIFVCGCAKGPEDIPTSVTEGIAAAACAAGRSEVEFNDKPAEIVEIPVSVDDHPRIGVYICSCGSNIGGVVDVEEVASYASSLDGVVYSERFMYTCSEDTQKEIQDNIVEKGLNRILIAACSPRSHLNLFRETAHAAGLNPNLVGLVSLREMDSWVHMGEPEKATEKAKTIVRMGVANMRHARPMMEIEQKVTPVALVMGGGVAGMSSALAIAQSGFQVTILEKDRDLGGSTLRRMTRGNQDLDPRKLVESLKERVNSDQRIKVLTSTIPIGVKGSIGNFVVEIRSTLDKNTPNLERRLERAGVIIVATGAKDLEMKGYLEYGKDERIVSQAEFEKLISERRTELKTVIQVLCVGAREKGREYCALNCCETAMKDLIELKAINQDVEVYVLYRDIRTSGLLEKLYKQASEAGIRFIRYDPEFPPRVDRNDSLEITVRDQSLDITLRIESDILVLSQPLIPNLDNKQLSEIMKIPLSQNGFFLEAHPKLRPVDSFTEGIFLAGTAQGPKGIKESMSQGLAAASRALVPLLQGRVIQEPTVAMVEQDLCTGCARCVEACPFGAMGMKVANYQVTAEVDTMLCKGCGKCVVACPSRAVSLFGFTCDQMLSQIDEVLAEREGDEPRAVAFLCNWCAYAGADNAGVSRFQYPTNVFPIRVMCSGRVDPLHVLYALLSGADGVFIGGCHLGDCHYVSGNELMKARIERLISMVEDFGLEPERIRVEWVSASEGKKFAEVITDFVEDLKRLGPSPLRPLDEEEVKEEKGVV